MLNFFEKRDTSKIEEGLIEAESRLKAAEYQIDQGNITRETLKELGEAFGRYLEASTRGVYPIGKTDNVTFDPNAQ